MKPYVLTVRATIVNEAGACLLLRRSAANKSFVGCWEFPGGKIDPGEDFVTALHREADEEAGIRIELTGLAGSMEFELLHVQAVLLCMEARITGGAIRLSHEHDDWAWVALTDFHSRKFPEPLRDFMLNFSTRKAGLI